MSLLIGTRKGAFVFNKKEKSWEISPPIMLGHIIQHVVSDPHNPRNLIMGAKTGHLGPTVYHSNDYGKTWNESSKPPAFAKAKEGEKEKAVDAVWWITRGHDSEANTWYAGTSPPGLFRSEDNGDTWAPVDGFNDNPNYSKWAEQGETPGGQPLHSINIDPRDKKHMYIGISVGGVFESTDQGKSWAPLNQGCAADFLPDPSVEYGHDPHCMVLHPLKPDRLFQQNHCGIYRIDRPSNKWVRIGDNMPKEVGDIGFPIVLHPRDPNTAWVFPMDGSTVWPRTSPDGKPCVYVTTDSGDSWTRLDNGLPKNNAYFTVKRQAMCCDENDPPGLYFGTSQGEIWGSVNGGDSWQCLIKHLPEVYSLTVMKSDS